MQKFFDENSSFPLVFVKNKLVKLVPACRFEKAKDELIRIADSGDTEHLVEFLKMLLYNSKLIHLGGVTYIMNAVIPIKAIDSRLDSEVMKKMKERDLEKTENDVKELFLYCNEMLNEKKIDDESIGAIDYRRENMYFSIETNGGSKYVYACKFIPSFRIRYESQSNNHNERRNRSGVWEMSECVIGTQIISTPSKGKKKLAFNRSPTILYPKRYKNPYVYSSGSICVGTLNGTETERRIIKMNFIEAVYSFLKQVELIITQGYSEYSAPASAHLYNTTFDRYKVKKPNGDFITIEEEEQEEIARITREIKLRTKTVKQICKEYKRRAENKDWE